MQGIWKLSLATAFLFTLGACSNSSSSAAEDDDTEYSSSAKGESNGGKSSSSTSSAACKSLTEKTLATPSNLQVIKNGENKWVLIWDYSANDDRPETGFVVESLDMSDSLPKWKSVGSTNAAVVMYNLEGESKSGKYYRVSAKDDCGVSKATDMVEIAATGANAITNADLATPSNLKLENVGDNMWQLSWSYTNNENRPEQGFKLQSLNLDDKSPKWSDDGTTNKGVHVVKIDGNKKGGLLFHVAAKDDKGISEYSEEITIPRVTDTTSSSNSMDLAVPTSLKIDSIGVNKYQLSWSYADNTNRPENGFRVQALNLTAAKPAWAVIDSTNKGVRFIIIDATKQGGRYIRVAAKDSKGTSTYSSEIQVPQADTTKVAGQEIDLAVPTKLTLTTLGDNQYLLSWSYTNNDKRPENGFKLQSLNFNATNPQWADDGTTNKGVYVIKIDGNKKGGLLFRVAAKDSKGISEYSESITIPSVSDGSGTSSSVDLAVPTNLKADSIGVNKYQLSWSYTDNANRPENGFRLQVLDLSVAKPAWANLDSTSKGVRLYNIDATKHGGKYIRVAAKDSKGVSTYSDEVMVPNADTTKVAGEELDLAVPKNLVLDPLGNDEYRLSWEYTNTPKRPATGFVLQKLYIANGKNWEDVKASVGKDVQFYNLSAEDCNYYIRIAAKDSKGISDYSNVIEIPKIGAEEGEEEVATPPSELTISRIAPSVWELSWNYSDASDDPNRKFIIQTSKLKDFKWTGLESPIDGSVRRYYIQGRDKIETYYRMAVVNGSDTSAFTDAIQLTPDISYRDYMALEVPVPSEKFILGYTTAYEADQDTSTKDDKTYISASATYTITENFISKYIVESEYTDTVYYEARWFTSLENFNYYKGSCEGKKTSDKCDSCYWSETFPYQEPSITKRFDESDFADEAKTKTIFASCEESSGYDVDEHSLLYSASTSADKWEEIMAHETGMSMCIPKYVRGICGYYVQIRIVWKDINGETDWSEWTQPFNIADISGADDLCNPSK